MKKLLLLIGSVLLLSLPLKADLPGQPANSWVQGKNWYCNNGYEKKENKCVSIFDDSQSQEDLAKEKAAKEKAKKQKAAKDKAAKEKAAKKKAAEEKARKEKAAKEKTELNKTYDLNEINKERLKDLKELFEEELINEQEYNQKKQEILDQL